MEKKTHQVIIIKLELELEQQRILFRFCLNSVMYSISVASKKKEILLQCAINKCIYCSSPSVMHNNISTR